MSSNGSCTRTSPPRDDNDNSRTHSLQLWLLFAGEDDPGLLCRDQRRVEIAPGHEGQRENVLRLIVREARERPRDYLAEAVRKIDRYLLRLGMGAGEGGR